MEFDFNGFNNTESDANTENVNRAEEMNNELFASSVATESVSADGVSPDPYDKINEYGVTLPNGGFDPDELRRPSPARRAWITLSTCVLAAVMGFFGAVAGIYALSEAGFSDSNSMLSNIIVNGSGLELNRVQADESNVMYTGGLIEVSERVLKSVVELKELQANASGEGYVENGSASGVIISADGYIVTNEHVTYGIEKLRVTLFDGAVYTADVIAQDDITDIALIKVELPEGVMLTPATLGVSAGVKYGQSVLAVGNPMGFGLSVSKGIVSAPDREITSEGVVSRVIQTDAALSPGNSGGGLFDAYGNLIGIVCAKTIDDSVEGLGYAIPIDTVKAVVNDLAKYKYVKGRAALGISIYSVFSSSAYNELKNGELAGYLFDSRYGVYIGGTVYEDSPFRKGDRFTMIGDERVTSSGRITEILKGYKPGDVVEITVERLTEDPNDGNAFEQVKFEIELYERDW